MMARRSGKRHAFADGQMPKWNDAPAIGKQRARSLRHLIAASWLTQISVDFAE
jgi:hypothetical protein